MDCEVSNVNIVAVRRERERINMNYKAVIEDVLKDALLGGALAAEIFVKNPAHQDSAARMLTAANTLIQAITSQMNGQVNAVKSATGNPTAGQ